MVHYQNHYKKILLLHNHLAGLLQMVLVQDHFSVLLRQLIMR